MLRTVSCHDKITSAKSSWAQNNPAIGLEHVETNGALTTRDFGQLVRDSYGAWGAMGGRAWQWNLAETEAFRLDVGAAAGLWYRTTAVNKSEIRHARVYLYHMTREGEAYTHTTTRLQRLVVPFALPLATITHKQSGIALNVSVLPRTSINRRVLVPTTTVMVQTSFPVPVF